MAINDKIYDSVFYFFNAYHVSNGDVLSCDFACDYEDIKRKIYEN